MTRSNHRKTFLSVFSVTSVARFFTFVLVLLSVFALACGKRKPPQPPKERVLQKVEVVGYQRGNKVILSWKMPARNADKGSSLHIDRADIYRLAEPLNSPQSLTEEEFSNRANIIAAYKIEDADFGLKTLQYSDQLQFAGQAVRLRYAIRLVNASGQKAGYSNFLLIEPAARVANSPSNLTTSLSQNAVGLKWSEPAANIDGTTPANILGYNIYRSPSEKEPARQLNQSPVTKPEFADENFEFGKKYFYFVRAVSVGSQAEPVESSESEIVSLETIDKFPPSSPTAITLGVGQNMISIFFAVNPETDIAGYSIYRSTDETLDKAKWELLTPELLKTNTFQDRTVESGKTYFYYITATDKYKNVSERSEVVSEELP